MSLASRLAVLPITNVDAWNKVKATVNSNTGGFQPTGRSLEIRYYDPATAEWEFADINESKQRAIEQLLRWQPLGSDHFREWLKNDEVKINNFNHPSDPEFFKVYNEIHWLCGMMEVSHELNFCEAEGSWYWRIISAAPAEEFTGKNYSLSTASECVLQHLFKIGKDYICRERGINPETPEAPTEGIAWVGKRLLSVNKGEKGIDFEKRGRVYFHGVSGAKLSMRDGAAVDIELSRMPHRDEGIVEFMAIELGHRVGVIQFNLSEQQISWDVMECVKGLQVEYTAQITVER